MKKIAALFVYQTLLCLFFAQPSISQKDSTTLPNYRQLRQILAVETVLYSGTIYGLNKAWYKNSFTKFSFNGDGNEWLGQDKVGHFFTAYQISRSTAMLYSQTGISQKQSAVYGSLSGFLFLLPIEILDGFQYPDYGFSKGDMLANTLGSAFFLLQNTVLDRRSIKVKYSFHPTSLAKIRPELLGRNLSEQWLKDYNGQTYWLSMPINSLIKSKNIPSWLCFSVGHGIDNMIGAEVTKSQNLGYDPIRQWYFALDIDLTKIKTKNKTLKSVLTLVNTIKFPMPTLEWNRKNGLRGHIIYF